MQHRSVETVEYGTEIEWYKRATEESWAELAIVRPVNRQPPVSISHTHDTNQTDSLTLTKLYFQRKSIKQFNIDQLIIILLVNVYTTKIEIKHEILLLKKYNFHSNKPLVVSIWKYCSQHILKISYHCDDSLKSSISTLSSSFFPCKNLNFHKNTKTMTLKIVSS